MIAVVVEDLGAGTAWAGMPMAQKLSDAWHLLSPMRTMRSAGTPTSFSQMSKASSSVADGHQQALFGQLEGTGRNSHAKPDGVLFEVVTEAEVAQHLEEGMVRAVPADVFQVIVFAASPHATLGRGGTVI